MNKARLAELQRELAARVRIPPAGSGYQPRQGDVLFSLDVQYVQERAYVALDAREWEGATLGVFVGETEVKTPYVPQYFCFREGLPLLAMIQAAQGRLPLRGHLSLRPDLIIMDGHGLAHPRRFGLACWVGVKTGVPTIGCAKRTLLQYSGEVEKTRGSYLLIEDGDEVLGSVLRTQDGVRPVFVSPGHKISLQTAMQVILRLASRYRIPEPLRLADQSARAFAQGIEVLGIRHLGRVALND
jgi:deoxyribonuclease V